MTAVSPSMMPKPEYDPSEGKRKSQSKPKENVLEAINAASSSQALPRPRSITTKPANEETSKKTTEASSVLMPPKKQDKGALLVKQMVNRAQIALVKENPNKGRKALLTELLKKPEQLLDDISRLGDLQIGKYKNIREDRVGKTPESLYTSMAEKLRDLIYASNDSLTLTHSTLDELLYASVQTFFLDLLAEEATDPNLRGTNTQGEDTWGPDKDRTKQSTSYQMEKSLLSKPESIILTRRVEKTYIPLEGSSNKKKNLVMELKCNYNLKTKEVTFSKNYKVT